MSILNLLPAVAKVYNFTSTSDGMGGFTRSWVLLTTTKTRLYLRKAKMVVNERGIDNASEGKAIFDILDVDNLKSGYKLEVDDVEYLLKRKDIVYGKSAPHHVECAIELYQENA